MGWLGWLLDALLICGLALLALLSLHLATLTTLRLLLPTRARPTSLPADTDLPTVLVQLPLYNEGALVASALAGITALDWPRERLVIQVLDDSTDGSLAMSRHAVAGLRLRGWRVSLHHRVHRSGFKAGALATGLRVCQAPFVAVFDADFRPSSDFLRRTLGVLLADPGLGHVQARWLHANRSASVLTRAQARLLDGHFGIEQAVRHRLGLPVPFNGTCGVWRRAAIDAAGGWSGDTLTEDLDLSLRARLAGWDSAYLEDLGVPGELPASARAWRAQQFRWTKGFVQCLVKLAPRVWAAPLAVGHKAFISLQLAQPLSFLVGTLCLVAALPFIAGAVAPSPVLMGVALVTTSVGLLGPLALLVAGGRLGQVRPAPLPVLAREAVLALMLSSGLLLSNARAALEALLGIPSAFVRTPKSAARPVRSGWAARVLSGLPELVAGGGLLVFVLTRQPLALPPLGLAIGGLLCVGLLLRRSDGAGVPAPGQAAADATTALDTVGALPAEVVSLPAQAGGPPQGLKPWAAHADPAPAGLLRRDSHR
jgi:cellulose synthase/poly-beta-1,6-N-acetylglucosamine synthase-like glycosyltransferase